MKATAYFINTARSGLVDYDALLKVLQEKKIAGAALDVFDEEPFPADYPFLALDNVTLTSHRAGATLDAALNSPKLVFERIENLIRDGKTQGLVNPEVLDNEEFRKWRVRAKEELGL